MRGDAEDEIAPLSEKCDEMGVDNTSRAFEGCVNSLDVKDKERDADCDEPECNRTIELVLPECGGSAREEAQHVTIAAMLAKRRRYDRAGRG